ncbi:MAG TPA: dihydrofolate reductase family protein [Stenomitos sp.]
MRRLFDRTMPGGPGAVDVHDVLSGLTFPDGAGDRPYTWVNMIVSVDGKAVFGPPGTTWTVGSEVDHAIFKGLRGSADAVLTGAGVMLADDIPYPRLDLHAQARREARGLRPKPLWIIVSGRAQLPCDLQVFRGGRENVLVVVTERAPAEQCRTLAEKAQILVLGASTIDMGELGRVLRARYGIRRLYSIGGPTLNGAMLAAGTLDELFFTLAPKLHGGHGLPSMVEGPNPDQLSGASLLSVYQANDELFLRYAVSPHAREAWPGV